MTVTMWEAKAAPGRCEELLAWVLTHASGQAQIYRSHDDRVVVIDPADGPGEAPAWLLARPAHRWRFEPVERRPPPA